MVLVIKPAVAQHENHIGIQYALKKKHWRKECERKNGSGSGRHEHRIWHRRRASSCDGHLLYVTANDGMPFDRIFLSTSPDRIFHRSTHWISTDIAIDNSFVL